MTEASERTVVIGAAGGAWGDTSFALPQLLASRRCDYVILEALAEITMAILTRAQQKNPRAGYAIDVVEMIGKHIGELRAQKIRVITNAGGVNPRAAADALRARAEAAGVALRIATVEGDDLMSRLDELGVDGAPISFNVYLGARPIAAALDAGADVVITGRCVDSALTLGPLIHEFGWAPDALAALSGGSLAGHLIECGPQATGGLLTDWEDLASWEDIGFPIAECSDDGTFVLTKPEGTGGLVDARTTSEQIVYEIGDPSAYLLPDVSCDWRSVRVEEVGLDRVRVRGASGASPPQTLKALAQVHDGYKVRTLLFIGGRDAVRKAERLGEDIRARAARVLERDGSPPLRAFEVEVLGAESTYGPHSRARAAREVLLAIAMHHDSPQSLEAIVREIPSFGLAVPGLSGGGTGLARPTPLIRLESHLIDREQVRPIVRIDGEAHPFVEATVSSGVSAAPAEVSSEPPPIEDPVEVPLVAIAHGRSGDKGADANIGVRARHPDFFPLLRAQLTTEVVRGALAHRIAGAVERFELPGIHALNFLLRDALGGGGIASLRFDPQGKAYAQQLLDQPVRVPRAWLEHPALRREALDPG